MSLNEQFVFKDTTHLLPVQSHPFDTPSLVQGCERELWRVKRKLVRKKREKKTRTLEEIGIGERGESEWWRNKEEKRAVREDFMRENMKMRKRDNKKLENGEADVNILLFCFSDKTYVLQYFICTFNKTKAIWIRLLFSFSFFVE